MERGVTPQQVFVRGVGIDHQRINPHVVGTVPRFDLAVVGRCRLVGAFDDGAKGQ